jgi:hypothetical protein
MDIRAVANKQENYEKKGLKVEQGGLWSEMVAVNLRLNYKTQGQGKNTYFICPTQPITGYSSVT